MLYLRILGLVLIASFVTGVVSAKEPCPAKVRVVFFDFAVPPLFNGKGPQFDSPPGHLVEWVRRAVEQTSCAPPLERSRRPTKRAYQELAYDEVDFVALSAPSPERERQVAFPRFKGQVDRRMAFYVTQTSLWVRKGERNIHWDGKNLTGPPGFKVGVPPGTPMESTSRQRGWEVDVAVNGPNSLEKLLIGRVPVTLVADVTVYALPGEKEAQLERLEPTLDVSYYYSTPSHAFYAKYPEFVEQYWQALCKLSRTEAALPEQKRLPACR